MSRLRIALVGAGNRASTVYLPIIQILDRDLELVAVCDVREEAARAAAERAGVPAFTDVREMVERTRPEIAAVVITPSRNHEVGIPLAEMGVHYLTETPLDTDLAQGRAMIETAQRHRVKVEVAENYYRVPIERIKRAMILEGVFGKILAAYNDFQGHGYHGVGLIRSYVGFEVSARRVFGFQRQFSVAPHTYRGAEHTRETWTHGVIEFENGSVGVFNFSSLSYGSPLRPLRSSKFLGESGGCLDDRPYLLEEDGTRTRWIEIERRTHRVNGRETLAALVAKTEPPILWENPLRDYPLSDGQISVASELMSLVRAVREDTEPEYGAWNGYVDREIDVAMARSAAQGGAPVALPIE